MKTFTSFPGCYSEELNFPIGSIQAHHRHARRWDVLWAVHTLAQRWRELQVRAPSPAQPALSQRLGLRDWWTGCAGVVPLFFWYVITHITWQDPTVLLCALPCLSSALYSAARTCGMPPTSAR